MAGCGGELGRDGELGCDELNLEVAGPADGPTVVVAASADEPMADGYASAAGVPADLGTATGVCGAGEAAVTVIGTVTAAAGPAEPLAVHATVATLNPTANAVIRPVLVTHSRIHRTINISISVSVPVGWSMAGA